MDLDHFNQFAIQIRQQLIDRISVVNAVVVAQRVVFVGGILPLLVSDGAQQIPIAQLRFLL